MLPTVPCLSSIDGLANVHDIQVTTQDCQWKCHAPSLYNLPSNMTVLYHGHGMHTSFARKACYAWDGARIVSSRVNAARWRRSCIPNRCKYIWYISWGILLARGLLVLFDTFITFVLLLCFYGSYLAFRVCPGLVNEHGHTVWHPLASRGHHSAQSKLYVCLGYTGSSRTKLYSESRTYSAAYSYHMHGNNVHGCASCFNLPTSPLYMCIVRFVLELLPNLHDVQIKFPGP